MELERQVRDTQRMVFDAIRELTGVDYQTLIERDLAEAIRAHDEAERLVRSRCVTPESRAAWATYRDNRASSIARLRRRNANGNESPRTEYAGSDISMPKTLDGRGARRRRASRQV